MTYEITLPDFEGPLDLLLHLIKQENINITEISIDKITSQYLDYINKMDEMNLNIASEYLVMAAELIEIKSSTLLPKKEIEDDQYEEDPKEALINKLLEYEQYKNVTNTFKELEALRQEVYTKEPNILNEYQEYQEYQENIDYGVNLNDLIEALRKFMEQKDLSKPLNTKITNKEYSVGKRCNEIRKILKQKKQVNFTDLFDIITKEYIIVTFLSILSMSRKQEVELEQENNFKNIIIKEKGV